ncbi:MAG: peptide chain release factor N(5)-glutamine methyltransferase [Phycisphaerae bacterium]|nr:peptide chain release factor N(5)-glutamine methyltransferase [Phycisphaerae bacterium]
MPASDAHTEAWTIARLLAWTREYLQRHEVESPRLCSEILLAHALGCERLRLFTRHEEVPERQVLDRFRASVTSAADGRPIAHITGTKEFFSLPFEVTGDVLIPRPETEILVERIIHMVRRAEQPPRRLLDVGTGSGCIAISLARHLPDVGICASDISEAALAVARRNAERHKVADRIDFRHGDLFAPWLADGAASFDIIASNPPYIAADTYAGLSRTVRDYEPRGALLAGSDGLDVIRRLLAESPGVLSPGGHLLFEMAFDQAAAVRNLLDSTDWCEMVTYRDGGGHDRVLHARRPNVDHARHA